MIQKENKNAKQEEAKKKAAMDAIRRNDFDTYINMINTEKNSRIMEILEKTNEFLEQLGAKVSL